MFGKQAAKAASGLLSLALVATMCPAAGLAFAAEGEGVASGSAGMQTDGSGADRVNQDVQLDTSGASGGTSGESASGASSDEDAEKGASRDEGVQSEVADSSMSSSADSSSRYTSSAGGQTSADVSLDGTAKVGTIEYGGLAYTINENDTATVSVSGLASSAPKGDLIIPSQIVCGSDLYKVTKIARGGGSLR